ncbi:MAG TPA: exosortase system-associated protein, TIGR04073 family [Methylococcaceae bacterium]|nr:exosortase system-associated protein, TIGR04073 family [Methylococcaceae bacterium]
MRKLLPCLVAASLFSSAALAEYGSMSGSPQAPARKTVTSAAPDNRCAAGASNLVGGWLELPKNVVNVTNKSDFIIFGLFGGLFKGTIDTIGRTGGGLLDLVACPFNVEPVIQPGYIWNDFQKDTSYGRIFYPAPEKAE